VIISRTFKKPMDWATDYQLEVMSRELLEELGDLHETEFKEAAKRNGYESIDREIRWRGKTVRAQASRSEGECFGDSGGTAGAVIADRVREAAGIGEDLFADSVG
tara:strand:- start:62 stop:376 length:315 start_codon:yes stop_codon:yes gene_type:complete